jgi:2,4-dienoyl-CoA reductase (NADPH2)
VVGAGPAGLAAATTLAERGHAVDLFDAAPTSAASSTWRGAFPARRSSPRRCATSPPHRAHRRGAAPGHAGEADALAAAGFDAVLLATGVTPRNPRIPGQDTPGVLSYIDVLRDRKPGGPARGGGGRGRHRLRRGRVPGSRRHVGTRRRRWTCGLAAANGAWPTRPRCAAAWCAPSRRRRRQVTLLQRKAGKPGAGLGKTTGWIHRAALKMKGWRCWRRQLRAHRPDRGLFVTYGRTTATATVIECDTIVLCAGQEPLRELQAPLQRPASRCT